MADKTITRRLNIYINGKEVENSLGGIQSGSKKVWNEMRRLDKASADYDVTMQKLIKDYKALKKEEADWKDQLKETPTLLGKIKTAIGPVATGMLAAFSIQGVVNGFFDEIKKGWEVIREFDQKQADLAAIMGKSRVGIAALTADAIKYGSTTSYNATQVSELQTELARLGKTEKEIRSMTQAVLYSATALESDLGPAAELVGGQLNSFMEDASAAQKYSDIMANSVNISATSFASLSTALPKVSAVAFENNVTFEKLNATLGVLADRNIAAETAGTGFRNILLTAADAGKPYEELLQKVAKSTDRTKTATELFGKENATVAVIMAASTDKINANTKALENSAGAAEKLAKEKLNSIKGAAENFAGAWEGVTLSLDKGDGALSRFTKSLLNVGAGILGLLNPMKKLSDELEDEQLAINMSVSEITSYNQGNTTRKQLLDDLKAKYPDLLKNVDAETTSNKELNTILNGINESYIKRIVLQKQVEKLEALGNKGAEWLEGRTKLEQELFTYLNSLKGKMQLEVSIDKNNLEKSAKEVSEEIKRTNKGGLWGSELSKIENLTGRMRAYGGAYKGVNAEMATMRGEIQQMAASFGIETEAQNAAKKAAQEHEAALKSLRDEAASLGMKNAQTAPELDVKKFIAAYRERLKYAGETDEEKKAREKKENAQKKADEKRLRDEQQLQKDLLASRKAANDANLDILADGYEKERLQANEEFTQKIADLKLKQKTEAEIKAVQDKLAVAKKSGKSDQVAYYEKQLADMLAINKNYNAAIVNAEQQRMIKIAGIQEKYLLKEVQRTEDANQSELQALQTKQAYEMAGFTSLQKAKGELANYLSKEELGKVKTLEDAKLALKQVHAKQEYELQEKHLLDMMALWQGLLGQEVETGIPIFSEEQRASILKFLDDAGLKIAQIQEGKAATGKPSAEERNANINLTSGLDVLGMSPDQWEQIYANIDTYKGKLQAIGAVAGALQQAFGAYFNYVNASEQASLTKYERSVNRKKRALDNQLDRGFISQDLYNARVAKLDEELEKKKARIAYKQAKRERAMSVASIISSTALAIMGIWAQFPKVDFGATAAIMSGVVGALGATQLATVLATPLPSPEGFKKGGYTGDGNPNEIAGPAHKGEYVIPHKELFSRDPMIPQIVGYLEAKRKGKRGFFDGGFTSEEDNAPSMVDRLPTGTSTVSNAELTAALNKNSDFLEQLLQEGVTGFVVVDVKAAKRIREKQRELEKIENTAKG